MKVVRMNPTFIHGHWEGWNLPMLMFDLDEEIEWGLNGEWIVDVLCVKDNIMLLSLLIEIMMDNFGSYYG
jgi:hypothetical protein